MSTSSSAWKSNLGCLLAKTCYFTVQTTLACLAHSNDVTPLIRLYLPTAVLSNRLFSAKSTVWARAFLHWICRSLQQPLIYGRVAHRSTGAACVWPLSVFLFCFYCYWFSPHVKFKVAWIASRAHLHLPTVAASRGVLNKSRGVCTYFWRHFMVIVGNELVYIISAKQSTQLLSGDFLSSFS